ncbi:MAG: hypothetical protein P9M10_09900 [Candidatus Euphemobacter frigidus]|nr:hypothetical protein [Candidatus Euphemobacter frigidus]
MDEEIEKPRSETGISGLVWFGIAIAGAVATALSVYLCYYSYRGGFAQTSWPVVTAGLGLIIAFCILTVALVAGIKTFIIRRWRRFWPISTMVVSGLSLVSLIGLLILGVML